MNTDTDVKDVKTIENEMSENMAVYLIVKIVGKYERGARRDNKRKY